MHTVRPLKIKKPATDMIDIILLIIILSVIYMIGSIIEKNHFKKLKKEEVEYIKLPAGGFGCKNWSSNKQIKDVGIVCGEAAIGCDYFKMFVSNLKSFFGGRLTSVESVLDRARREAIVRMKEKAKKIGANVIINVKIESTMLNECEQKNMLPQCLVIAYGTAIKYE